jgi:hypothetical protein
VLAAIIEAAIRERLDLDVMAEVATRSADIRDSVEHKLRAAGLWSGP